MAVTTGFMTHATCRLTAKNRDQLRNPTHGNRVWATFTFTFKQLAYNVYRPNRLDEQASSCDNRLQ